MSALVVDDARAGRYDFGAGHPMAPARLELTASLVRQAGLLDRPGVAVRGAEPLPDAELLRVHAPDYLQAVQDAVESPRHGLTAPDCPPFPAMHEAAARQCAATWTALRAVHAGEADRALTWLGGLHHAMPAKASGFCVYNDAAVAIAMLLDAGAERVAYLDLDVHHGDGVERVFWRDPRVLTVSLHQSPTTLFPGSGFPQDVGGPGAEGFAANVALPPGTGDADWLAAIVAAAAPLLEAFAPEVLVTQHGADVHALDPLASLGVSMTGMRGAALLARSLADRYAGGRWVALGGGGYEVSRVVPRAWAHLAAVVTGQPLPAEGPLPEEWLGQVRALGLPAPGGWGDGTPPATLGEPYVHGADAGPVRAAVGLMRNAVLPRLGVDPGMRVDWAWFAGRLAGEGGECRAE